jgi:hypothetical protein
MAPAAPEHHGASRSRARFSCRTFRLDQVLVGRAEVGGPGRRAVPTGPAGRGRAGLEPLPQGLALAVQEALAEQGAAHHGHHQVAGQQHRDHQPDHVLPAHSRSTPRTTRPTSANDATVSRTATRATVKPTASPTRGRTGNPGSGWAPGPPAARRPGSRERPREPVDCTEPVAPIDAARSKDRHEIQTPTAGIFTEPLHPPAGRRTANPVAALLSARYRGGPPRTAGRRPRPTGAADVARLGHDVG